MSILSWKESERPRERLMENGAESLSSAELLAILIGSGTTRKSAVEVMRDVLTACDGSLRRLGALSPEELCAHDGIGPAKATALVAAMELARRREREEIPQGERITSSGDIFRFYKTRIGDRPTEEFHVLLLKQNLAVLASKPLSHGGLTSTLVDLRRLFSLILTAGAPAFAVCHNHPSGSVRPSPQDERITADIAAAARILSLRFVDHVIVSTTEHYSFADEGKI